MALFRNKWWVLKKLASWNSLSRTMHIYLKPHYNVFHQHTSSTTSMDDFSGCPVLAAYVRTCPVIPHSPIGRTEMAGTPCLDLYLIATEKHTPQGWKENITVLLCLWIVEGTFWYLNISSQSTIPSHVTKLPTSFQLLKMFRMLPNLASFASCHCQFLKIRVFETIYVRRKHLAPLLAKQWRVRETGRFKFETWT